MENFDQTNFSEENAYIPENTPVEEPAPQNPYRGAGTGRKESPYADSPYVMQHPQPEENRREQNYWEQPRYEAPQKPKKPKKQKKGFFKKLLAAVLALAVVGGSCGVTAWLVSDYWADQTEQMKKSFDHQILALQSQIDAISSANTGNSVSGSPVASDGSLTPSQVYAQNVDSVVLISCEVVSSAYGQSVVGYSRGSGFILTENGYILTNAHVVDGATSVVVITYGGESYAAEVCGADSTNDVAVLKVNAENLPAVTVGSSANLIVGDQVVAIGNPLGELTATMTVGYVSAKDRNVTTDGTTINMIQTDAAINSGNSGGPLFNMKGEVVGITSAKYSGSSASGATIEGIGFAIPMDDVMKLTGDLMEFGYVKGAYMGVMIADMDEQTAALAKVYGLPVGPIIQSREDGSAAAKAGIEAGDIVLKLGNTDIATVSDLTRALRNYQPGDSTTVVVYRSGQTLNLTITFDEKPADTSASTQETVPQETAPQGGNGGQQEGGSFDWFNPFGDWGFDWGE